MAEAEPRPATITLRGVTKRYGDVAAVVDLSLDVEAGECLGLLGPSGCGKTTILNLIAGFLRPDGGAISIDERRIDDVPAHRRNIGVVFQSYALFPHLTVRRNVAFGLQMRGLPASEVSRRVGDALRLAQIDAFGDRTPRELSGGQQQRVALARALVIRPRVLLLDEPLSNLDANLREELRFEIRRVQRAVGITAIFVTHDQHEALVIADRIAVLRAGRVEQVGTPAEVYRAPRSLFVATFMGQANGVAGTLVAAEGGGAVVRTEAGLVLRSARPAPGRVGAAVALVVRPENVVVSVGPTERENCLAAVVTSVAYLGAVTHVTATAGEQSFRAFVHDPSGLPGAGSPCFVSWRAEDCLALGGEP